MSYGTVFTTAGKGLDTSALVSGHSGAVAPYVGFGTGTTTPTVSDTALATELTTGTQAGYSRTTGTPSQQTTSVTDDTYQNQASITSAGTTTPLPITEAGNFDATSSGNLMIHAVFAAINLNSGDTLTIKLQLELT